MLKQAEYIWLDGNKPTKTLRSKTRILELGDRLPTLSDFPDWGFDGSSTNQAEGSNSDCALRAVDFVLDPIRGEGNYLVLCEVLNPDQTPHTTNTRAKLRHILESGADKVEAFFGFEQEYTLFQGRKPIGWPSDGFPAPQGPYYCGVGGDRIFGREIIEIHTQACVDAGLMIFGVNAEVMAGQWEFQIGYRGFKNEIADALTTADHMWLAKWLLHRICEDFGVTASFDNKPVKGDWNGAGCHTNFSTREMRDSKTGKATIKQYIDRLGKMHKEHIVLYGDENALRLTGAHETCSINEFKAGASDRGASIRIPMATAEKGYGYLEDRRPGANADPYLVCARILATICDIEGSALSLEEKKIVT